MFQHFVKDFQSFAFSNNTIEAAAGFCIGMYTKDMLVTFLQKLVYPALLWLAKFTMLHATYFHVANSNPFWLAPLVVFAWAVFEYALFVMMTFIILEYIINRRIIGLKTLVPDKSMGDFEKSKCKNAKHHHHPPPPVGGPLLRPGPPQPRAGTPRVPDSRDV